MSIKHKFVSYDLESPYLLSCLPVKYACAIVAVCIWCFLKTKEYRWKPLPYNILGLNQNYIFF